MKLLGMHEAKIINVSVNNDNIRFSAKDVKKGLSCFNWLVDEIGTKQEATPKTIIFCRSINDVSVVLSYLLKKLGHLAYMDENKSPTKCLLGVYHSNSPTELKERVRKSFKNDDGPIRVVIATSALSLVVNFKDIKDIWSCSRFAEPLARSRKSWQKWQRRIQYYILPWPAAASLRQKN